jgi:integrase/recombinase XerD
MNLAQVVAAYVTHRQAMGMRFRTEARILQSFSRALGEVRSIREITADQLLAFLAGTGPVMRNWERKHSALGGLYRFAVARGYVDHPPLPRTVPRPQEAFVPYIYSREELRRLLDSVAANDHPGCHIDPDTYRTILWRRAAHKRSACTIKTRGQAERVFQDERKAVLRLTISESACEMGTSGIEQIAS